jgi:hypothetical protein
MLVLTACDTMVGRVTGLDAADAIFTRDTMRTVAACHLAVAAVPPVQQLQQSGKSAAIFQGCASAKTTI